MPDLLSTGHLLARTFDFGAFCLSLDTGACVESSGGVAEILAEAATGASRTAIAERLSERHHLDPGIVAATIDRVFDGLGHTGDAVAPVLWAQPACAPAFQPIGWDPPHRHPERHLASLPRRTHWLLLVAGVSARERAEAALGTWTRLTRGARRGRERRVLPLVWANLRQQGSRAELPGIAPLVRRTWAGNEVALHRATPIVQRLHDEGIPAVFLKGAASTIADYRDTALRPMLDLDILIPPAQLRSGIDVLERCGLKGRDAGRRRLAREQHSCSFQRGDGLAVDLHWHALWTNLNADLDEPLWRSVQPATLHGAPCFVPDPACRLLVTCVHGLRWGQPGSATWPADAAVLLAAHGPRLDWDLFVREAMARHVVLASREALQYLADALGAPIPADVLRTLRGARIAVFERTIFRMTQRNQARTWFVNVLLVRLLQAWRDRPLREFLLTLLTVDPRRLVRLWRKRRVGPGTGKERLAR